MKRMILGLVAFSLLAVSPAFAASEATVMDGKQTHRQELRDKWKNATPEARAAMREKHHARMKERMKNATPEERAKMKARMKSRKQRHQHRHGAMQQHGDSRPAGQPQGGFMPRAVQQH